MEQATAAECVRDLCDAFSRELGGRGFDLYVDAVAAFDEEAGVEAVYGAIRDAVHFPRIAELRESYRSIRERQERERAWDRADDRGLPKDSTAAQRETDRRQALTAMLRKLDEPPPTPEPGAQLTRSDLVRCDRRGRRVCRWDVADPGWQDAWGHVTTVATERADGA